jgi:hypothetical protein
MKPVVRTTRVDTRTGPISSAAIASGCQSSRTEQRMEFYGGAVRLIEQTDPLSPAFPLCSESRTCEKLLDSAFLRAAGFFLSHGTAD